MNELPDINVKAYAKLNLCLDVGRRMENGYHEVSTVMQSINLYDDITIHFDGGDSISAESSLSYLPKGDKNIAVKAAKLFFEAAEMSARGCVIKINKRIPICAGMAGGSTDGAAVLRVLNEAFQTGFSRIELEALATRLGSDVPFCVAGGTILCRGRGEILTELKSLPKCWTVVCKPPFPMSTPELFALIDSAPIKHRPDTEGLVKAIGQGSLTGVARRVYNVFEDILPLRYSEIARIKSKLLDFGALAASMTGTGSAVFGLFDSIEKAKKAYETLKKIYNDCFLAESLEKYV